MKLLPILAAALLAACNPAPRSTLHSVVTVQYNELPDIDYPPAPALAPLVVDVPRDLEQRMVRNVSDCLVVPEPKRDADFWRRCGTFKPLANSNIFVGFDQHNWELFQQNWAKLEARERMWQARIDEVNRQRQVWRAKAKEQ